MQPTLSQVCSLHAPFGKDVVDYSAAGWKHLELWLGKLDQFLETQSLATARKLLDDHDIIPVAASFQGGLLISQGEQRREQWRAFAQRLEQCRALGVSTLIVAGDLNGPLTQTDVDRAYTSLAQAAQQAQTAGLRLAFEFQHQATLANNLQSAVMLIQQVGAPNLGLCLDVFHYYKGPSKLEDMELLTPDNLFHVQLCDLAGIPRELARDADRILPGDGDFQLVPLIERLKTIGYAGPVCVEILNPDLWETPPRQLGESALQALARVL